MPAIWRTNVAVIGRTIGEAGRNTVCIAGRHGLVHARHLHFIVEVGAVAQAADQQRGARLARGLDHQAGKGDAGQFAFGRARQRRADLLSMASRSSAENSGALPGLTPTASTSLSASRTAWRTTSRWPLVTGSNDPA